MDPAILYPSFEQIERNIFDKDQAHKNRALVNLHRLYYNNKSAVVKSSVQHLDILRMQRIRKLSDSFN